MNSRPLPPETTTDDLRCLAEIDRSVANLDQAFADLSDRSFRCLSRRYQRLADVVFAVMAERARFAS